MLYLNFGFNWKVAHGYRFKTILTTFGNLCHLLDGYATAYCSGNKGISVCEVYEVTLRPPEQL